MNLQNEGTLTQSPKPRPLFYVVDWLPPDFGAVGQYAVLFATEIAMNGRHVELIGLTSGQDGVSDQYFVSGGSLRVTRISASHYDKSRNVKRLLWTVTTNFRLMSQVIRNPRSRQAEVLFTGSPPFMLVFSFLAKLLRGAALTYRITDFFPEVIAAAHRDLPLLPRSIPPLPDARGPGWRYVSSADDLGLCSCGRARRAVSRGGRRSSTTPASGTRR